MFWQKCEGDGTTSERSVKIELNEVNGQWLSQYVVDGESSYRIQTRLSEKKIAQNYVVF
jgi:hypothetical protein